MLLQNSNNSNANVANKANNALNNVVKNATNAVNNAPKKIIIIGFKEERVNTPEATYKLKPSYTK